MLYSEKLGIQQLELFDFIKRFIQLKRTPITKDVRAKKKSKIIINK